MRQAQMRRIMKRIKTMKNHRILRLLITLPVLFAAAVFTRAAETLPAAKPNIVFILCDDLGYGDVHCLNPDRGKIMTPNIDRLASQGMTFTDSHSGSSVCSPTRYGIMTGRYAWRSRLQNGVLRGFVEPLIAQDRLTVAGLLKKNGYYTAAMGKWHLGFTLEGGFKGSGKLPDVAPVGSVTHDGPLTRGFDNFFGWQAPNETCAYFENDRVTKVGPAVEALPWFARRASDLIGERAKKPEPFFLYLALPSPHVPIVPNDDWKGKSGLGNYGDYVMETDWAVGEVLKALDESGAGTNTLVIFTSDNGCSPAAGTKRLESMGHFASGVFRGYKADIWDGGHHVAFFARWPDVVKPGSKCAQLICHTDLMATLADILGVKLDDHAGEDSFSMLPLLKGENAPIQGYVVHHSINGMFAIRDADWKLELCPGSGGWAAPRDEAAFAEKLPPIQLYNMRADISEKINQQGQNPEVVKRLFAALKKIVADGRSTPGPVEKNDVAVDIYKSPVTKARLDPMED